MAYKSSIEGTELTFLRTKTLTPMMLSPSVKKKKIEMTRTKKETNSFQLFFAAMLQNKPLMRFLRKEINRIYSHNKK